MSPIMIETLSQSLRNRLIRQVRATVSGSPDGRPSITPSDDAYFAPGSIVRQVHGDVTSMMVGGMSALLLQMLHPAVLAGVWDHSNFRADMPGRLHRTARFIATTTFGPRTDADSAIARVRHIHASVSGRLPDGTPYQAGDPALLSWVHVAEATCFFDAWRRFGGVSPATGDEDAYFTSFAPIAEALGASPVPRTRTEANDFIAALRPTLVVDGRTREVAHLLADPPGASRSRRPAYRLVFRSAVDLLPPWARELHGFPARGFADAASRAGTSALAHMLRWAFAKESRK